MQIYADFSLNNLRKFALIRGKNLGKVLDAEVTLEEGTYLRDNVFAS